MFDMNDFYIQLLDLEKIKFYHVDTLATGDTVYYYMNDSNIFIVTCLGVFNLIEPSFRYLASKGYIKIKSILCFNRTSV